MLETLKNGDTHRFGTPDAVATGQCVTDWSLPEPAEIPFIEVGGPKKLEASSQVLSAKHPAQARVQPPHAPTEKSLAAAAPVVAAPVVSQSTKIVHMAEARSLGVAFEAWPGIKKLTRAVASEIVAYHQRDSAGGQQYLALFDQMAQTLREDSGVILLTGIRGMVGTSTVLLNLAVSCAQERKKRVVVWEAGIARASLASRLGLEAQAGVTDVLRGSAALDKVILETAIPGLFVLPAMGDVAQTAPGACTPEAARWLLSWLRERFDLVFIDGPNLDNTLALGILAPLADDLYLVAPQAEKHLLHPGMAQTVARLGGRLRGLVHTQFEV